MIRRDVLTDEIMETCDHCGGAITYGQTVIDADPLFLHLRCLASWEKRYVRPTAAGGTCDGCGEALDDSAVETPEGIYHRDCWDEWLFEHEVDVW